MEVVSLDSSLQHYAFEDPNDPAALAHLEGLLKVHDALYAGTLYCRYIDGDRKGSIARVSPRHEDADKKPVIKRSARWYSRDPERYEFDNKYFWVYCTWDKRRNKIQEDFPHREAEFLIGYEGPTIWEKFDSKAAKEEVLKNPDQRDIDDNVLNVGDRVLYINARYGSGMTLERGTITEFYAVVDSKSTSITTIIQSDEGEQSQLSYPHRMVYKL